MPSGVRLVLGTTLTLVSADSGEQVPYTIDLSWVADRLPDMDQDDEVEIEVMALSDGRLMALRVINTSGRSGSSNPGGSTGSQVLGEQPRRASDDPAPTPTFTPTPAPTATATFAFGSVITAIPTATSSATLTATATSSATPTLTAISTITTTPTSSATATPGPSSTATATPSPTSTATASPTTTATPAPRVYVANAFADTVSVIDTATNTVIATIAVGDGPLGVAISP